jgi:ankyrin repeat protein
LQKTKDVLEIEQNFNQARDTNSITLQQLVSQAQEDNSTQRSIAYSNFKVLNTFKSTRGIETWTEVFDAFEQTSRNFNWKQDLKGLLVVVNGMYTNKLNNAFLRQQEDALEVLLGSNMNGSSSSDNSSGEGGSSISVSLSTSFSAVATKANYNEEKSAELLDLFTDIYLSDVEEDEIDAGEVSALIFDGADPNIADEDGNTVLMLAAAMSLVDVVTALLRDGASVDRQNHLNETALSLLNTIVDEDDNSAVDIARLICSKKPNLNLLCSSTTRPSVLYHFGGSCEGDAKVLNVLLTCTGALCNDEYDGEGWERTLLHHVCSQSVTEVPHSGPENCVRELTAAGASLDSTNASMRTPLMCAVLSMRLECVKVLLDNRADALAQDASGNTALHMAMTSGVVDIVKAILEAHARVDAANDTTAEALAVKNAAGMTVVHLANALAGNIIDQQTYNLACSMNAVLDKSCANLTQAAAAKCAQASTLAPARISFTNVAEQLVARAGAIVPEGQESLLRQRVRLAFRAGICAKENTVLIEELLMAPLQNQVKKYGLPLVYRASAVVGEGSVCKKIKVPELKLILKGFFHLLHAAQKTQFFDSNCYGLVTRHERQRERVLRNSDVNLSSAIVAGGAVTGGGAAGSEPARQSSETAGNKRKRCISSKTLRDINSPHLQLNMDGKVNCTCCKQTFANIDKTGLKRHIECKQHTDRAAKAKVREDQSASMAVAYRTNNDSTRHKLATPEQFIFRKGLVQELLGAGIPLHKIESSSSFAAWIEDVSRVSIGGTRLLRDYIPALIGDEKLLLRQEVRGRKVQFFADSSPTQNLDVHGIYVRFVSFNNDVPVVCQRLIDFQLLKEHCSAAQQIQLYQGVCTDYAIPIHDVVGFTLDGASVNHSTLKEWSSTDASFVPLSVVCYAHFGSLLGQHLCCPIVDHFYTVMVGVMTYASAKNTWRDIVGTFPPSFQAVRWHIIVDFIKYFYANFEHLRAFNLALIRNQLCRKSAAKLAFILATDSNVRKLKLWMAVYVSFSVPIKAATDVSEGDGLVALGMYKIWKPVQSCLTDTVTFTPSSCFSDLKQPVADYLQDQASCPLSLAQREAHEAAALGAAAALATAVAALATADSAALAVAIAAAAAGGARRQTRGMGNHDNLSSGARAMMTPAQAYLRQQELEQSLLSLKDQAAEEKAQREAEQQQRDEILQEKKEAATEKLAVAALKAPLSTEEQVVAAIELMRVPVRQYFDSKLLAQDGDRTSTFAFFKGVGILNVAAIAETEAAAAFELIDCMCSNHPHMNTSAFKAGMKEDFPRLQNLAKHALLFRNEDDPKFTEPSESLEWHWQHKGGAESNRFWWDAMELATLAQPSEACCERLFSLFRNKWGDQQYSALGDSMRASMEYNINVLARKKGK